MSLRARKGVAISWYCVRFRTLYQEIATAFGLTMTNLWFCGFAPTVSTCKMILRNGPPLHLH